MGLPVPKEVFRFNRFERQDGNVPHGQVENLIYFTYDWVGPNRSLLESEDIVSKSMSVSSYILSP